MYDLRKCTIFSFPQGPGPLQTALGHFLPGDLGLPSLYPKFQYGSFRGAAQPAQLPAELEQAPQFIYPGLGPRGAGRSLVKGLLEWWGQPSGSGSGVSVHHGLLHAGGEPVKYFSSKASIFTHLHGPPLFHLFQLINFLVILKVLVGADHPYAESVAQKLTKLKGVNEEKNV